MIVTPPDPCPQIKGIVKYLIKISHKWRFVKGGNSKTPEKQSTRSFLRSEKGFFRLCRKLTLRMCRRRDFSGPIAISPEEKKRQSSVVPVITGKNPGQQNASRCRIKSNQVIVPDSKKAAKTVNLNGISIFFQRRLCTCQAFFYWKVKLSLPAKSH